MEEERCGGKKRSETNNIKNYSDPEKFKTRLVLIKIPKLKDCQYSYQNFALLFSLGLGRSQNLSRFGPKMNTKVAFNTHPPPP